MLAQNAAQPDQALITNLVIANRVLASDDLGVLRVYGHISARSQRNANRFYIARNVAPALVTSRDIIETDLDGNAIGATRPDQNEERFIDAAVYKARPEVMAVVHMHSPELIAFSVSSTPLPSGGAAASVYDIRKFNNGRIGEITTIELGHTLAQALGRSNAILLMGHGAVTVATSAPAAISGANGLRRSALLQTQMIAMGGKINPNPREVPGGRAQAPAQPATTPSPASGQRGGLDTRNNAGDRAWDHWRRVGARMVQATSINAPAQSSDPVQQIKQDLVIARSVGKIRGASLHH